MGTIRSLAEILQRHSDMPAPKLAKSLGVLTDETARLSDRLGVVEEAAAPAASERWPGIPAEPRELLEEAIARTPEASVHFEQTDQEVPMVLVEPYTWVCSLSRVLQWIADRSPGSAPVLATVSADEVHVVTTFRVEARAPGSPAGLEALLVEFVGEGSMPLGDAVQKNRGELWSTETDGAYQVRLALVRASAVSSTQVHVAEDQPEFYDFDLFLPKPSGVTEELLRIPLESVESVEFVVFDSETTGLHPYRGDEMVSLSAGRIRRGKLQHADMFDTLTNPGRNIPRDSMRFHGITEKMGQDAPALEQIYPKFVEYVGNAVLVAHCAGFDKKFLDMAAERYGPPQLGNPILDTLFLFFGMHKDLSEDYNLDTIAERLGVKIEGRHSSLGDCRTTGEVFPRLLPVPKAKGVNTLGDANSLSDRMLSLRWQQSRF